MAIAQSDIFAPVISLIEAESMLHAAELYAQCPYGLTAAIFCEPRGERGARTLAGMLRAGTVLINDVIAPTVDPRVSFGGRGASGYGVTRGAEGLLEMTAVKTLLIGVAAETRCTCRPRRMRMRRCLPGSLQRCTARDGRGDGADCEGSSAARERGSSVAARVL
jgi:delta 1-pyrroline-5-carboxylate dehydrogenase